MLFSKQTFLVAGLSRSGISAAEYLLNRQARVYLYDDVQGGAVALAADGLTQKGAILLTGETLYTRAEECDILVLSPGIPIDHPLAVFFRKAGKRVLGEAELGVLALICPVVAVTGTNGKTTTVSLIDAIFHAAEKKSIACGNIGRPITSCVEELKEDAVAVAEISSFQLETLTSLRPHVAVILNVTEDHLNRHYNMENYVFLKSRIMKNCTESEYIVLNRDDEIVRSFAQKTKAKIIWFSVREHVDGAYLSDGAFYYCGERICAQDEFVLDGLHNGANALAAIAVAKIMGIETPAIVKGLKQFQGVAHRIQRVGEINGVTFVNDSKATNVDSTVKAIGCMRKETVLMLGGKDKGYSYEPLFEEIKKSSVVHVVLYGENAFRILSCALKSGFTAITLCREFDMAVRIAYLTARNGQTLLLSPASASFDAFSNYEERGNRFVAIYDQMKTEYERIAEKVGGSECEESGAQLSCDKE